MAEKQYDNTDRGGLWINKRKEKDTHPDYTGSINVGGVDYWLSAWKKYSPNSGEAFLSISIKKKDEQRPASPKPTNNVDDFLGAPKTPAMKTPLDDDYSSDIPF